MYKNLRYKTNAKQLKIHPNSQNIISACHLFHCQYLMHLSKRTSTLVTLLCLTTIQYNTHKICENLLMVKQAQLEKYGVPSSILSYK
jgi:hypothetical protein